MRPNAVLLFAAGLGTRMAPLTHDRPKPLIPVAGRTLLDHALDHCGGLRRVVNIHYLGGQIRNHLANHQVLISDETEKLLETGGGLKKARPLLQSNPVVTLNTDAVWRGDNPVHHLLAKWDPAHMEALLLLIPTKRAIGHQGTGDFDLAADGQISPGSETVYTGAQIIQTDGLDQISEPAFSMWSLWRDMFERQVMFGTTYNGEWCDVGRPENLALAETLLKGRADV